MESRQDSCRPGLFLFSVSEYQLGEVHIPSLPDEIPEDYSENEGFLKLAHRALLEVDVIEGVLVCPETGREFPISNGIPNMLVNEGE